MTTSIFWRNPDTDKPSHNQKIIIETRYGIEWGNYLYDTCGEFITEEVLQEGSTYSREDWSFVTGWIPYPEIPESVKLKEKELDWLVDNIKEIHSTSSKAK